MQSNKRLADKALALLRKSIDSVTTQGNRAKQLSHIRASLPNALGVYHQHLIGDLPYPRGEGVAHQEVRSNGITSITRGKNPQCEVSKGPLPVWKDVDIVAVNPEDLAVKGSVASGVGEDATERAEGRKEAQNGQDGVLRNPFGFVEEGEARVLRVCANPRLVAIEVGGKVASMQSLGRQWARNQKVKVRIAVRGANPVYQPFFPKI